MPSSPTRPLVDRIIPGGLEKFLRNARTDRLSYHAIAVKLAVKHKIDVTPPTVMAWCNDYGITKGAKAPGE